jgi:hypothetical protein
VHRAFAAGLNLAFVVAAALGLVAALLVLACVRAGGAERGREVAPRGQVPEPAVQRSPRSLA